MSIYKCVNKAKPKRGIKTKISVVAIVLAVVAVTISVYLNNVCYPNAVAYCRAEISALAQLCVNHAVVSVIDDKMDASALVVIERDGSRIVSVGCDSYKINTLAAAISLAVQNEINKTGEYRIAIPLGTLSHSPILVGIGPDVVFDVKPIASVVCLIKTDFSSCGVNQTLQRVYLEVVTNVEVVIPAMTSTVNTTTPVLLSENVIVGEVPQMYLGSNVLN